MGTSKMNIWLLFKRLKQRGLLLVVTQVDWNVFRKNWFRSVSLNHQYNYMVLSGVTMLCS